MLIKKRSKLPTVKTGQVGPSIPTVKTGQVGPFIPTAKSAQAPSISANMSNKANEMSVVARLRSAKKGAPKEEAQAPRTRTNAVDEDGEFEVKSDEKGIWEDPNSAKQRYLERLKKRSK